MDMVMIPIWSCALPVYNIVPQNFAEYFQSKQISNEDSFRARLKAIEGCMS